MVINKATVVMENWKIPLTPRVELGYSGENDVCEFEVITEPQEGFTYYLELQPLIEEANNILLTPDYVEGRIYVELTTEMLGSGGVKKAQIVAYIDTEDAPIKKSNVFEVEVDASINATKSVESHYQTALSQWSQILASFNPQEILAVLSVIEAELTDKQDKLTAGTNITIDENNVISATGGGGGTNNYNDLTNKPKINNVELSGNKTLGNLGIQAKLTESNGISIIDGLSNTPEVSVKLKSGSAFLNFNSSKELYLNDLVLALNEDFRNNLADDSYLGALARKYDLYEMVPLPEDEDEGKVLRVDDEGNTEWNDLADYVKNTDYATNNKPGVFKTGAGLAVASNGLVYGVERSYANYLNDTNSTFIAKGTLENILNNDSRIKLPTSTSADNGKFLRVNAQGNAEWQTETAIITDTTSTTASLTLANDTEYRYTQELSSITLTLPQTPDNNFISGLVFESGTTPTAMTYDSSIKWSGDDVTSNAFVPVASKTYNIVFWFDGININAVARGV